MLGFDGHIRLLKDGDKVPSLEYFLRNKGNYEEVLNIFGLTSSNELFKAKENSQELINYNGFPDCYTIKFKDLPNLKDLIEKHEHRENGVKIFRLNEELYNSLHDDDTLICCYWDLG